jgi:hypothetical protein
LGDVLRYTHTRDEAKERRGVLQTGSIIKSTFSRVNSRMIGTWKRKINSTKDNPIVLFPLTCSHHSTRWFATFLFTIALFHKFE